MNENIYLIYGSEKHLIDIEIKNIVSMLSTDINYVNYDMQELNISVALEYLNTISLFSEKKIISCSNSYFLTGKPQEITHNTDDLIKTLSHNIDNILIISVVAEKLDDRKKVVKELKNKTIVKVCNKLVGKELEKYIYDYITKDKYTISKETVAYFIDIAGNDLDSLINEADKLKLYTLENKNISIEDIDLLSLKKINDNVFDLVDAVIKRNLERSLQLYDDLLVLNEEAIKLIVIIANQFRLVYQTKSMYKEGYSEFEISKHLEVHPYRIKLANEIRIDENVLLSYIEKLADLDLKIKTGLVDKNIAFEMFLLEI